MYLKNLTILGFKSFADKTSLDFPPGITAIVGPNGCGKSNVADSIRWVLGEQSAKALRGGEMSDIIFNGTESRRPLSMAEVSLTICDVDREQLRAANLDLLFNEVTVTRRIYRDGSNEYFLNKVPCRLKDIQQLFLGTGVGRTSYSILAQGHITQILSSRPEDRRMIFEEAAGITRFKVQKKEALRKLDQTETNLLRLNDTIREIKRQIGSLQRQAGKAKRYKALATDLRFLETQYSLHSFSDTQTELSASQEEAAALESSIAQCNLDIAAAEERIAQARRDAEQLEHQISERQKQALEARGKIDALKSSIAFAEERIRESEALGTKATEEISRANEQSLNAQQELEELNRVIANTKSELECERETVRARNEALRSVDANLVAKQNALRDVQNRLYAVTQKLNRARNEINSLDIQKQGDAVRLETLKTEIEKNRQEIEHLEARIQAFNQSAATDKQVSEEKKAQLQRLQSELGKLQSEAQNLNRRQDDLYRQVAGRKSRLNVLEQLQSSREGFGAGAQALLKAHKNDAQTKGILGALVDKIRIPQEYITPVETLLGTRLQLILTQGAKDAQALLEELRVGKKGQASLAPLNWNTPTPQSLPNNGLNTDACAQKPVRILDIIRADEDTLRLLQRLIGSSWIVDRLETAVALWLQQPGSYEFITTQGDILTQQGIFIGGSHKEVPVSSSILGRNNEIASLKEEVEKLEQAITDLKTEREEVADKQKGFQEQIIQIQAEIRSHEVAVATRLGEFRAMDNNLRIHKRKHDTLVEETTRLSARNAESSTRRQLLSTQIEQAELEEKGHNENIGEINSDIDELRHTRDAAQNALTEIKIALASKEQFFNTQQLQKKSAENRIAEYARTVEARTKEMNGAMQKVSRCREEIAESKLNIDFQTAEYNQFNQHIADLTQRKNTLSAEIEERDNALKNLRRKLASNQEHQSDLSVRIAQHQMTLENLTRRIQEKYQLDIATLIPEPFTIQQDADDIVIHHIEAAQSASKSATEEGEASEETQLSESGPSVPMPEVDWDIVARTIADLQDRIDRLGPVNLVAIEEYEEIEARHQFLTEQQDDMIKAKAQLLDVVSRINQETRIMFTETFEQIRKNFRNMFATFFHGGSADLKLVDERDVLESGIEIVAKPPGKQPKSVSLLSGGEQTMTAVALLFAIYQVRPSPFCVLDELDAPLDEANVDRFIAVLKQFVEFSQFIVITHSKLTISAANSIHGVTMPERGVTKMISMKFQELTDENI